MPFTKVGIGGPAEAVWSGNEAPGETWIIDQLDKTPINEMTAAISTYTYVPTTTFAASASNRTAAFTTSDLAD